MRHRKVAAASGMLALALATGSFAQDSKRPGLYVGLGLELFDLEVQGTDNGTDFDLQSRPLGIVGRVGYNIGEYVAVEAFASTGIHEDPNEGDIGVGGKSRSGETELKSIYGAAIRPQYTFTFGETTQLTTYLVGGYAQYDLEGSAGDNTASNNLRVDFTRDDSGEYFGGGIQINGDVASLQLQYVTYQSEDDTDLEGFQASVNRYF